MSNERMADLPDPFTPADCDLRGMPYMPLDISRLLDSDFYTLSSGDEFKAGLSLWVKAFGQVPAGSLPDNDRLLAHLSGANGTWRKVKAMALHGWIKCSDGRLYHRTVAEKVAEAWRARLERRARTAAARAARHAANPPRDSGSPLYVTEPVTSPVTSPATDPVTDNVTSSKGSTREGKGREEERKEEYPPYAPPRGGRVGEIVDFGAFGQRKRRKTAKAERADRLQEMRDAVAKAANARLAAMAECSS